MLSRSVNLQAVKILHTLIWAFFAGCIVAVPISSLYGAHRIAIALVAIVFVEVLVLLFNGWRCPLTGIAARYTDDRQENFDIYLPRLLAKYNKHVFGTLYVVGTVYALLAWAYDRAA
jgi:hypothetical protein